MSTVLRVWLCAGAAALAACASEPSYYWIRAPLELEPASAPNRPTLLVSSVRGASPYAADAMICRGPRGTLQNVHETWATSPVEMVHGYVVDVLRASGSFRYVGNEPAARFDETRTYRLELELLSFDFDLEASPTTAVAEVRFILSRLKGAGADESGDVDRILLAEALRDRQEAKGPEVPDWVEAMSGALAKISAQLRDKVSQEVRQDTAGIVPASGTPRGP
jgi:uncharacterized lipoprotein YmbA